MEESPTSSPRSALGDYFPQPQRPADPVYWWRRVCWVTDRVAISGDLPGDPAPAREHLKYWEREGISDVIDVRGEVDDSEFIALYSSIESHWFGVDDNGDARDFTWFTQLSERATAILENPERRVLVHCHMGVNRGPSAAYAILLALNWHHLEALEAIRDARPIATVKYAGDAAMWHVRERQVESVAASELVGEVNEWVYRNRLDEYYLIGEIGSQTAPTL